MLECRPLRSTLIRALWQPALWAVPFALFFSLLMAPSARGLLLMFQVALLFSYSIRIFMILAFRLVIPRVAPAGDGVRDPRRVLSWIEGIVCLVAAMVGAYAAAIIIHFTLVPGFLGTPRAILLSGTFTLLFALLFTGVSYAVVFYRQAVERARAVEQARAELAEAELRALRAQIHPHFLFNTLNTIAALIAENPRAAEDTTTRLAEVFRYVLQASDRDRSRLGDELAFVRAYLDIERTRFGDRLRVVEAIEAGLELVTVPSLLLQPLVENAVRHGAAARPSGGTVRLEARRAEGRLVIEIGDDGPGMNGGGRPGGNGFGLHSVRERLRAAGPPHALEIDSAPDRGTRVRVTLPLEADSAAAPPPGA